MPNSSHKEKIEKKLFSNISKKLVRYSQKTLGIDIFQWASTQINLADFTNSFIHMIQDAYAQSLLPHYQTYLCSPFFWTSDEINDKMLCISAINPISCYFDDNLTINLLSQEGLEKYLLPKGYHLAYGLMENHIVFIDKTHKPFKAMKYPIPESDSSEYTQYVNFLNNLKNERISFYQETINNPTDIHIITKKNKLNCKHISDVIKIFNFYPTATTKPISLKMFYKHLKQLSSQIAIRAFRLLQAFMEKGSIDDLQQNATEHLIGAFILAYKEIASEFQPIPSAYFTHKLLPYLSFDIPTINRIQTNVFKIAYSGNINDFNQPSEQSDEMIKTQLLKIMDIRPFSSPLINSGFYSPKKNTYSPLISPETLFQLKHPNKTYHDVLDYINQIFQKNSLLAPIIFYAIVCNKPLCQAIASAVRTQANRYNLEDYQHFYFESHDIYKNEPDKKQKAMHSFQLFNENDMLQMASDQLTYLQENVTQLKNFLASMKNENSILVNNNFEQDTLRLMTPLDQLKQDIHHKKQTIFYLTQTMMEAERNSLQKQLHQKIPCINNLEFLDNLAESQKMFAQNVDEFHTKSFLYQYEQLSTDEKLILIIDLICKEMPLDLQIQYQKGILQKIDYVLLDEEEQIHHVIDNIYEL